MRTLAFMTLVNIVIVCAALVLLEWGRQTMLILGLSLVFQWLLYEITLRETNSG